MNHTIVYYKGSSQSSDNIKNYDSSFSHINNYNNSATNQRIKKYNLLDDSEVYVNTENFEDMDEILHDLIKFTPIEEVNNLSPPDLLHDFCTIDTKTLSKIGEKYIALCIEPGDENIFKIDADKLQHLQIGINVTFPVDSGRFCIPCSEEFPIDFKLFDQHLYDENHVKILKQLIDRHKIVKNCIKDQVTDLDLAKSYMDINSEKSDYVTCYACNILVEKYGIENHMSLESHVKNIGPWKKSAESIFEEIKLVFCDAWYYAEKFICDLCSLKFCSDVTFANHLIKEEHLYKVRTAKRNNTEVEYNICGYCLTFWFGKANGYLTHCEGDFHKYLLQSESLTIEKLSPEIENILINFEKTIEEILELCDSLDKSMEENLLQSVRSITQGYYTFTEAFIYGSRKSLTNLIESNLDIYVDCVSSYSSIMSANSSTTHLRNILDQLHKFEEIWEVEEVIFQAKVPILKLKHRETNVNCDISCTNGLVVENSKLIRYYVEAYPPCRKLILFLKKWMHLCRLTGNKGVNSYTTCCLVIYYLQIENILPSVHELIKLEDNSNIIAGWETGYLKDFQSLTPSGNSQHLLNITDDESTEISCHRIKRLLIGFFSYYSNFNYITDVICPFLGKRNIKKEEFTSMDKLRKEMHNYKTLYGKGQTEMFRFNSPMCVQDPLDLSKNTTKALTKLQLRKFKKCCSESMYLLRTISINHSQR